MDSQAKKMQKSSADKTDTAFVAVRKDVSGLDARVEGLVGSTKDARARLWEQGEAIERAQARVAGHDEQLAAASELTSAHAARMDAAEAAAAEREREAHERAARAEERISALEARLLEVQAKASDQTNVIEAQTLEFAKKMVDERKKASEEKTAVEMRMVSIPLQNSPLPHSPDNIFFPVPLLYFVASFE